MLQVYIDFIVRYKGFLPNCFFQYESDLKPWIDSIDKAIYNSDDVVFEQKINIFEIKANIEQG